MPPSPSPPPTDHADKKSPADASESAPLPATEEMVKGTSPSIDEQEQDAGADVGFLQGKTFAQKMHSLLDMPDYSSIISWNDAGTAVIIHDVDAFISTVMPAYFQHAQFGSFTRRMRRWGFRVANYRSSTSTSSEQGQSSAMQFSCEHFLRDQPDLCLMMKDERQSKKKFQFLDRHVRMTDGVESNQGSSARGIVHYPSTPASRSAQLKSEIKRPIPVHYPPSSSNMNTANIQLESQPQSEMPYAIPNTTSDAGFSATHGYLHTYSQPAQMPSMISPYQHSLHNAMPMNMMMPTPNLSGVHYPSYGHGAPPPPPPPAGVGFGISPPAFQYPPPEGYHPYPQPHPQQQPHQQVQKQPQIQQQMPQQIQQQQIMSMMDARASAAASASTALLLSSSSEETPGLEFLPSKTSPDTKGRSKVNTEEKSSTKDRI